MATTIRDRLLQAAMEIFTNKAIADSTSQKIAQLAESSEVTLFRHFRNQPQLLEDVTH
jgi:AcrR family transcriptional regulator